MPAGENLMRERAAQTFALIHLIEAVLALVVIALIGLGVMGLIDGSRYYQEYFAKDNAYLVDTFHAVPNGDVDYGYLWANPNYAISIETDRVIVNKTAALPGGLDIGVGVTKYFGAGLGTLVQGGAFQPKYFRYSVTGSPQRIIKADGTLAVTGCPTGPALPGVRRGSYAFGNLDTVGSDLSNDIIEKARGLLSQQGKTLGTTGPSIYVAFEPSQTISIFIFDVAQTPVTARLTCMLEFKSASPDFQPARQSLGILPLDLRSSGADIVIVIKGRPNDREAIADELAKGIAAYDEPTSGTGATP